MRQTRYDFDKAALKPYLSLDAITAAVFDVAGRLFGLNFVRRADIKAYHEDVLVYEVWRRCGRVEEGWAKQSVP